jgi:TRAP-type C4-dicarboxylate transport system substrate-binding protein
LVKVKLHGLLLVLLLCNFLTTPGSSSAQRGDEPTIHLQVLGGNAGLRQYRDHEVPFWRDRVPELTGGQVQASISAFDRAGLNGEELLNYLRLGVISVANIPLSLASQEDPAIGAIDLPLLSQSMEALRKTVALWRPHLTELLRERYNSELLAVYTQMAQVVFCRRPFSSLLDLAGRRIRTSSVAQSEVVSALRAIPIIMPFAQVTDALRKDIVECVITGTFAGNEIGLHELTSHVSSLPISWFVSAVAFNRTAWAALPQLVQDRLRGGLRQLEAEIWLAAEQNTADGLACNAGLPSCLRGRRGSMTIVNEPDADTRRLLQVLAETVLPNWVARCGPECAETWNRIAAPSLHIWASEFWDAEE